MNIKKRKLIIVFHVSDVNTIHIIILIKYNKCLIYVCRKDQEMNM